MKTNALVVIMMLCISFVGCTKRGCTDPKAKNYDESAKKDDGSCIYIRDYRDAWVGFYDGTKEDIWWTPDTGGVSGPYNATLEVSLTENDSVLKINEVGSVQYQNAVYYVNTNGVLRSPSWRDDPYPGDDKGGSFVGDSLYYYVGVRSVGAGTKSRFYCKKRQ